MFTRTAEGFLAIVCSIYISSCASNNGRKPTIVHRDSMQIVIGNIAPINLPASHSGVIEVYDKNRLPQVIKDYYSLKWDGFNLANPNEEWDAGCTRGIVVYVDKKGREHSKFVQRPDKQLVSITIDTVSGKYIVVYDRGGIGTVRISDSFKVLKDGSLEIASSSR
jgi:hypothetical protein